MVGASPLISSWFHDEPTMEAANLLGFDVGTLGNHEFDEGGDELMRMLRGGQRTGRAALRRDADGRAREHLVAGLRRALPIPTSRRTRSTASGELRLPPYAIVERAGVRVGFIGVTTQSTPNFLLDRPRASASASPTSRTPSTAGCPCCAAAGCRRSSCWRTPAGPRRTSPTRRDFVGEIIDEAREMSSEVDAVIAGHSHSRLDIRVPNADGSGDKLIVEALSYGVAYDLVDLTIDRRHRRGGGEDGPRARTRRTTWRATRAIAALVEGYADAWRRSPPGCSAAPRPA